MHIKMFVFLQLGATGLFFFFLFLNNAGWYSLKSTAIVSLHNKMQTDIWRKLEQKKATPAFL